jgi:selenocysteine-specific elongation factor
VLHAGTAAVPVRVQRRDDGRLRLRLAHGLPLRQGDRAVLRDPGRREVLAGLTILAVDPLTRRDLRAAAHAGTRGLAAAARGPAAPATASERAYGTAGDTAYGEASLAPVGTLVAWLNAHPLRSPARADLAAWAVTARHLAEAERAGLVLRVGGLVLQPDSLTRVREVLPRLGERFRPGDVASALGTSRAVVVALLERLDAELVTRRLPDGSRELRA